MRSQLSAAATLVAAALSAALTLLAPSPAAAGGTATRAIAGVAHNQEGGKLAYRQAETERWIDGKRVRSLVSYSSPEGAVVGRREVLFGSAPWMPDEVFEDLRSGMRAESRQRGDGSIEVAYRTEATAKLKRKNFRTKLPAVNGAGVVEAIRGNWARLLRGGRVEIALVVPERLDWYHFRLRKIAARKRDGHDVIAFVLEPEGMLMRAVAGQLHFELDAASRGLVRYSGRVDLADLQGDPYRITVRFPGALPGTAPHGGDAPPGGMATDAPAARP